MSDSRLREQFAALYAELSQREWASPSVETKWIGYLFHITSLQNAISIVDTGLLLSRMSAVDSGAMQTDNAAATVIEGTSDEMKGCVRLFFRPRTPTFYHNEGFRSQQELEHAQYDAHCPVPIAFVLDAPTILSMNGVRFSDGTLASPSARVYSGVESFRRLPFDKIYHDGVIAASESSKEITFHRQAEVIIPSQLSLERTLVGVYCRSDAELATLRHLLNNRSLERYGRQIRTNTGAPLFEAKRLFVESVNTVGRQVVIVFNLPPNDFAFDAVFEAIFDAAQTPTMARKWRLVPHEHQRITIPLDTNSRDFVRAELNLYLDGNLAYSARHLLLPDEGITF